MSNNTLYTRRTMLTYIIEVRFEFGGAEDRQSVAQRVSFPQDLVVKRHLTCGARRQETSSNHKNCDEKMTLSRWQQTGGVGRGWRACNYEGASLDGVKSAERKRLIYEQLFSTLGVTFFIPTALLKRRRRPLTCLHRFDVLQNDLHPAVEHLYGAVLGDEVFSH